MNAGCTAAVPFTSFLISPFASAYGVERVLNGIGILTVLIVVSGILINRIFFVMDQKKTAAENK